jgi:biopolymer transport protein ExbD
MAVIHTRGRAMREARRTAQFAKFRLVQLNLVPLVDTFVSIVFFALTTQTLGSVVPVASGVNLPISKLQEAAEQQLTLGIGSSPAQVTLNGHRIMSVQEVASAVSNNPAQPLLVPGLYDALRAAADSVRSARATTAGPDSTIDTQLAIQGDKSMRYDLLSRVMMTARLAGFRNLTLQVMREGNDAAASGATAAAPERRATAGI